IAHGFDEAVDAIGFLHTLGYPPFETEALWRVTAGGADGPGGGEDARAGDDALIHGLFDFDIGVAGAFGAEVSDGGKACHQRGAAVVHGPGSAETEALVRDLIVPRGLAVGVKQDMR